MAETGLVQILEGALMVAGEAFSGATKPVYMGGSSVAGAPAALFPGAVRNTLIDCLSSAYNARRN